MANPINLFIKRPSFVLSMLRIRYNFNRYKSEIAINSKEIEQTSKNLPLSGFLVVDLTRILGEYYNVSHEISLLIQLTFC